MLSLLATLACAPAFLTVPEPEFSAIPDEGPAVDLHFPVDARPTEERRGGAWYTSSIPLPFVTHGDANLEPTGLGAIARATEGALGERGIPDAPAADIDVRLYVLRHAGTRDVSDAQWTSTLTGGLAGNVGKLLYPVFFVGYGTVRVEVITPERTVVRDVTAFSTQRMPVFRSWGWIYAFSRAPAKEAMTEVLLDTHAALGREIALVVDQARRGEEVSAGEAATTPSAHSLGTWSQADSFRREGVPPWVRAKYPAERFSLMTGHDTEKGEVVGRIAVPLDTLGYDVGVSDRLQWQLDVTLLGLVNEASTGLRVRLLRLGDLAFSLQGGLALTVGLPPSERYRPIVGALAARGSGIASWRPGEVTWYLRGGWSSLSVRHEFEELPELEEGAAIAVSGAPGLEFQLSTTALFAFELRTSATFQNGNPLALGELGAFTVIPQVAFGLR